MGVTRPLGDRVAWPDGLQKAREGLQAQDVPVACISQLDQSEVHRFWVLSSELWVNDTTHNPPPVGARWRPTALEIQPMSLHYS
jgi:hypothetical protein